MLRIAVQSKGRLYDETMELLAQAGIKFPAVKRTLLVPSRNFPVEVLYLRDDDIPDSVATGTADVGIVGMNEVLEKCQQVQVLHQLAVVACRLPFRAMWHITGCNGLKARRLLLLIHAY